MALVDQGRWIRRYVDAILADPDLRSARTSQLPLRLVDSASGSRLELSELGGCLAEAPLTWLAGPALSGKTGLLKSIVYDHGARALQGVAAEAVLADQDRLPVFLADVGPLLSSDPVAVVTGTVARRLRGQAVDGNSIRNVPLLLAIDGGTQDAIETILTAFDDVAVVAVGERGDLDGRTIAIDALDRQAIVDSLKALAPNDGLDLARFLNRHELWFLASRAGWIRVLVNLWQATRGTAGQRDVRRRFFLELLGDLGVLLEEPLRAVTIRRGPTPVELLKSDMAKALGPARVEEGLERALGSGLLERSGEGLVSFAVPDVADLLRSDWLLGEWDRERRVPKSLGSDFRGWSRPLEIILSGAEDTSRYVEEWLRDCGTEAGFTTLLQAAAAAGIQGRVVAMASAGGGARREALAAALAATGLEREAADLLQDLATAPQADRRASSLYARLLAASGKTEEAARLWRGMAEGQIDSREFAVAAAEATAAASPEAGLEELERVHDRLQAAEGRLELARARIFERTDRPDESAAAAGRAAELISGSRDLVDLGESLLSAGRVEAARTAFLQAQEGETEAEVLARSAIGLARTWEASGMMRPAVESLSSAAAARRQDGAIQADLARVYRMILKYDLSRLHLDRALELAPQSPPILREVGLLAEAIGDLNGAADAYQRVFDLSPKDSAAAVRLGLIRRALGEHVAAEALLTSAVEAEPDDAQTRNHLGVLLLELERNDEAIAQFRRCLELQPDNALFHRNLGDALVRAGRAAEAIASLDQAIRLAETDAESPTGRLITAEAQQIKGQALESQERSEEALEAYRSAAALRPGERSVPVGEGEPAIGSEEADETLPALSRAVQLRPDDPTARIELGRAQERAGRGKEAIATYRLGLQLKPADSELTLALVKALRDSNRIDESIEASNQGSPAAGAALPELARSLELAGRLAEALESYRQAARSDPDNSDLWLAVGRTSRLLGKAGEGLTALRTAITLNRTNSAGRIELALSLEHQGRYEEAREEILAALRLDPENALVHYQAGMIFRHLMRDAEALRHLRRAVDLAPERASWKVSLGHAYEQVGRKEEALDLFQQASALNPADSAALAGVGMLHRASGRIDDAVRALERALQWDPNNVSTKLQLGWALLDLGEVDRAAGVAAETADGGEVEALVLQAACLERQGSIPAALEKLTAALEIDPERLDWMRRFTAIAVDAGQLDAAEAMIARAAARGDSPALRHDLALISLRRGDWERAVSELERALEDGRDMAREELGRWRLEMADCYLAGRRHREVADQIATAEELGAPASEIDQRRARLAVADGDAAAAARLLDRLNPDGWESVALRAEVLLEEGQAGAAVEILEPLLRRGDDSTAETIDVDSVRRTLARALASGGDVEAAVTVLEAVVGQSELISDHIALGAWHRRLGRLDPARVSFERAVALDETSVESRLGAGRFALETDDLEHAHLHLAAAVELAPEDPEPHAALGEALDRLNQTDAALGSYRAALERGGGSITALKLAKLLTRAGDTGAAVEYARRAVELDEASSEAWLALGELLIEASDYAEAGRALQHAAGSAPEDGDLAGRAGLALTEIGQDRAGIALIVRAVESGHDSAYWAERLGDVFAERGRNEEALSHYQRAGEERQAGPTLQAKIARRLETAESDALLRELVSENGRDPGVLYEAAMAWDERGDAEPARDLMCRVVGLAPGRVGSALALAEMLRKEGGRVETASVLETTSAARLNVAERLRRATLWRALQRYDEAIDDVAEAQRATGDGFLAQRRVSLLREAGRSREALAVLTQISFDTDAAPGLEGLRAELLLDLGEAQGAVEAAHRAIERDSRPEHHLVLAFALERTGRFEAAREAVQRAVEAGADRDEVSRRLDSIAAKQTMERQQKRRLSAR